MWWPHAQKSQKGFTLIEIMVVVTIIGILVSILVLSFDQARKNSRDNARKASLKQLQLALETYRAQNGRYPAAGCGITDPQWAGSESDYTGSPAVTPCPNDYISGLAPSFIASLPSEVGFTKNRKGFAYRVTADGSSYKIITHHNVESQLVSGYGDEFARYPNPSCLSPFPDSEKDVYAVYSKGAECW